MGVLQILISKLSEYSTMKNRIKRVLKIVLGGERMKIFARI